MDLSRTGMIQDIISNADEVIKDDRINDRTGRRRDNLLFVKNYGKNTIVAISLEDSGDGKIVMHKSLHYTRENPYPNLKRIEVLPGGGRSPISTAGKPTPGGSLSARDASNVSEAGQNVKPAGNTGTKIEDFGEKIGGARKDVWQALGEKLAGNTESDIANQPLAKLFPEPNYQKLLDEGANPRMVGFIHAVRDMVAKEKRHRRMNAATVERVKGLLHTVGRMVREPELFSRFEELIAQHSPSLRGALESAIDLYSTVGHGVSLADYEIRAGLHTVHNGVRFDKPTLKYNVIRKTGKGWGVLSVASGDTKAEALAEFKKVFPTLLEEKGKAGAKPPKLIVWHNRYGAHKEFRVGVRVRGNYIELAGPFATADKAFDHIRDHEAEFVARFERMKDIPAERRAENAPRVGDDHREGKDVTPEKFADAFGFRGVEFGNWVEGDKRQEDLNEAYDALMDLAGVLDISPKALSLNGELGLAFGARGRGGKQAAAAHYEPGFVVINLTKKRGAGSLAHEWLHALDNYFARMAGNKHGGDFLSDRSRAFQNGLEHGDLRREVIDAWQNVREAIRSSGMKTRSDSLDAARSKPYWGTDVEMVARAFEAHIIDKLQSSGTVNDYLANIVSEQAWKATADQTQGYPYPTQDELPSLSKVFDDLFATIEERVTDKGIALASLRPGEHLPTVPEVRHRGVRREAVQAVADKLNGMAQNAAETRVVQGFDELPAHLRDALKGQEKTLEGVFDPKTGTVWLVADNLTGAERAAEVWAHEQFVHHGLRSLLSPGARQRMLNGLWLNMGGMGNATIREIAGRYGLDPRGNVNDRQTVMEEVLASMAEKKARGLLSGAEQSVWRKIVNAVRLAWQRLVEAVTGRPGTMGASNIDALLTQLGRHVMDGTGNTAREQAGEAALASQGDARTTTREDKAREYGKRVLEAAKKWADVVDRATHNTSIYGRLEMGATPDLLVELGIPGNTMRMELSTFNKITGRAKKHGHAHSLTIGQVKDLYRELADPVAVVRYGDNYTVVTGMFEGQSPIIAGLDVNATEKFVTVNELTSAYGKDRFVSWIRGKAQNGEVVYLDKNKLSELLDRLQGPNRTERIKEIQRAVRGKVKYPTDVVKPNLDQAGAPLGAISDQKKSLAWARTNRLQLPQVRRLPARLLEGRILNEGDIVKPSMWENSDSAPLASLAAPQGKPAGSVRFQQTGKSPSANDAVILPDGSTDFGMMDELRLNNGVVLKAAPFRLLRGRSHMGGGSGFTHIEDVHGDEIRASGYASVQEFVWDLVNDFNEIWEGERRSITLVRNKQNGKAAGFVELERNGGFYEIKSAFPVTGIYPQQRTRRLLWRQHSSASTATGRQNPFLPKDAWLGHAPTKPEGTPKSQRGQSIGDTITQQGTEDKSPLASLAAPQSPVSPTWKEHVSDMVRGLRKIAGRGVSEDVEEIIRNEREYARVMPKEDITLIERTLGKVAHWIAKNHPEFARLYNRQLRRQEERTAASMAAFESMPLLYGGKDRLNDAELEQLQGMIWQWDGKEIVSLRGIDKFTELEESINGRPQLEKNAEYDAAFQKWLDRQPQPKRVREAYGQVRRALDNAFLQAYNRMARMSEIADTDLEMYRTSFGHINKEVKRRSAVVGIFPCDASIVRLIGAVLMEQNDEWLLQDRYMPKESLERLTGSVKELAEK